MGRRAVSTYEPDSAPDPDVLSDMGLAAVGRDGMGKGGASV